GDGVGGGIDLDAEKIGVADFRIKAAVREFEVDGDRSLLASGLADTTPVIEEVALARLENDVNGILADDCRKGAGGGADQVADGEVRKPDAAVDRRANLGIA